LAQHAALAGVCAYVVGISMPISWGIPTTILAVAGGLTALSKHPGSGRSRNLSIPVLGFLVASALSFLVSRDMGRSLVLSGPLIPACLVYFLITDHFRSSRQTRFLYYSFSLVALMLALLVLRTLWKANWEVPPGWQNWSGAGQWIAEVNSPLLLVTNDVTFLAVAGPLSLAALICAKSRSLKIVSAVSILACVCAVALTQSRVAVLTMIVSMTAAMAFLRPRLSIGFGGIILGLSLSIDALQGFPLVAKLLSAWKAPMWDARIPIWESAWGTFLAAPILGSGPHTFSYVSADHIKVVWPHNLFLESLSEQGIVGLAALCLLLGSGLVLGLRTMRHGGPAESRTLTAGAVAALIGFCFAALLELTFLRLWVITVLFTLLAVIVQLASQARTEKEESFVS